jgi:Protein of unknown function (DUF2934)
MSRVATPPQTKTPSVPTPSHAALEKIAQRAYEKWVKRGCTHGCHLQDWTEAEAELKAEASGASKHGSPANTMTHGTTPPRR